MDPTFVIALAVVAWLEGVRRLDAQTAVMRKHGFGPWRVESGLRRNRPFHVVSIWPPLTLGIRVRLASPSSAQPSRVLRRQTRLRVRRVRGLATFARIVGVVTLALIVPGLPFAVSRFGTFGLIAVLAALLSLSTTCAIAVFTALRALGMPSREAIRATVPMISPFGALRGAEVILEHALAGAPAVAAAQALMPHDAFVQWVRRHAYDAVRSAQPGDLDPALASDLTAAFGRAELAKLVDSAPHDLPANARFCRRCGQSYAAGTKRCADCTDLPLYSSVA